MAGLLGTLCLVSACTARLPYDPGAPSEPFTFEAERVVNDGSSLHVFALIRANLNYSTEDVLVRLASYRSGRLLREIRQRLKTLMESPAPTLRAGETLRLAISLPVGEATDYQLGLIWGSEALKVATLEVRGQRIARPECENCPSVLLFDLVNAGNTRIAGATLGIDRSSNIDSRGDNEEHIDVSDLNLEAGEIRSVRLVIEGLKADDRVLSVSVIEAR